MNFPIPRMREESTAMKIAQIAPLYESVPPKLYGGTERVVSYLTEELVAMGHDVTLFASGDSQTTALLRPESEQALRLARGHVDSLARHMLMIEHVFREAYRFDVIHSHIDYLPYPQMRRCSVPVVTTLHGRLDLPDLVPMYDEFTDISVVSISYAQRKPLPLANWIGNVYHGLPGETLTLHERPGDYLAFLGRISPEKRVDRAIEIATKAGIPLKIAAKVDNADREYYRETIEPLLDNPLVDFIGEISEDEKDEFLGNARALLFPIDWPEPFGLVMIEAMGCGTPAIAWPSGSVQEVIDEGETGFIVTDIEAAVHAVHNIDSIDRKRCRAVFEERFSARRMAQDYVEIYQASQARATRRVDGEPWLTSSV